MMMVGQNPINVKYITERFAVQDQREHVAPQTPNSETKSQHEASHLKTGLGVATQEEKSELITPEHYKQMMTLTDLLKNKLT